MSNVRKMLLIAEVKPNEVVFDLGSGDGRFIITAAKEFHARSVGIEANPLWVLWTHGQILLSRLAGRVRIFWGNFYQMDLSEADVVILYLLQGTNNKLKQKLETELKLGTRVVSHYFTFLDWRPIETDSSSHIYLYEIGNHRYPS
ncbi:MAG: SAM-dependent methyltransferase [Candidatus Bathyarchaeota archaeon]|nr:MAG: SAM-dependent methyltransferase [Candidatus Bathyarchaeota archaeon]